MKGLCIIALLALGYVPAKSQSCVVPKPLTLEQKALVNGKWTGEYELDGATTGFDVSVDFRSAIAVRVSNPPLTGEATLDEQRFCGSGAFHFKKTINGAYYEFDGVPDGNKIEGTLVVVTLDGRKTGKFLLYRESL